MILICNASLYQDFRFGGDPKINSPVRAAKRTAWLMMLLSDFDELVQPKAPPNEGRFLLSVVIAALVHVLPSLCSWKVDRVSPSTKTHQIELLPIPETHQDPEEALPVKTTTAPVLQERAPRRTEQPPHASSPINMEESMLGAPPSPILPDPPSELLESTADSTAIVPSHAAQDDRDASRKRYSSAPLSRPIGRKRQLARTASLAQGIARIDWGQVQETIQHTIAARQRYPEVAQKMGLEGSVHVRFSFAPSGRFINSPEIIRSSGYALLDREALGMVRRAAPFIRLPRPWPARTVTFEIPISFSLERL